ncbi:hypothetical protein M422DRAFT_31220 [Sphaerobolus stellatus SS14]|uniref:DUF6533 domain-containing protein n=1 Tax=Sphaerobolus stellatus (strain SS14) TaxID=990650 RepID=A0A0C9VWD1_SPHS4|nr:hypothetical protein M422DRAFT_31220 [Sphaerobolus stellatus SS14]
MPPIAHTDGFFTIQEDRLFGLYVTTASLVLLIVDSLFSLSDELRYLWSNLRPLSFIYLLARYGSVGLIAVDILNQSQGLSQVTCNPALTGLTFALNILAAFGVQGLALATSLTVVHKNRWFQGILGTLFLALSAVRLALGEFANCNPNYISHPITTANNVLNLMFEAASMGLIMIHVWTIYKGRSRLESTSTKILTHLIRRDYVLELTAHSDSVIFVWALFNEIFQNVWTNRTSLSEKIVPIQDAVSAILMCRFYIKLCKIQEHLTEEHFEGEITTQFARHVPVRYKNVSDALDQDNYKDLDEDETDAEYYGQLTGFTDMDPAMSSRSSFSVGEDYKEDYNIDLEFGYDPREVDPVQVDVQVEVEVV